MPAALDYMSIQTGLLLLSLACIALLLLRPKTYRAIHDITDGLGSNSRTRIERKFGGVSISTISSEQHLDDRRMATGYDLSHAYGICSPLCISGRVDAYTLSSVQVGPRLPVRIPGPFLMVFSHRQHNHGHQEDAFR